MVIHIREFQYPQDYQTVYELWQTVGKGVHVGSSDAPAEIEKKLQRDPDLFLVAEADGKIIGSVIGGFDGRRGIIYHLAVSAAFRGLGIGSRLMSEVETRLRSKGCLKCYLLVAIDNVEAMEFYEKRDWYHMDAVKIYGKEF